MNQSAVLLDQYGTLIENIPYKPDPSMVRLTEGALVGLKRLQAAGYKLIVVSNQSGVARGQVREEELVPIQKRLVQLLKKGGVEVAGFYYCPHLPDAPVRQYAQRCFCRKPSPGLLFQAAREHNLNLAASWSVGDLLNDIEAGRRADCRTVLLDNGNETEWELSPLRRPHFTVSNLSEAAEVILSSGTDHQPAPRPVRSRLHQTAHRGSMADAG
jgi:histidinol-phosphate phosphatase family protein